MYVTENARNNDLLVYIYIDLNLDHTWFSNCRRRQVLLCGIGFGLAMVAVIEVKLALRNVHLRLQKQTW